MRRAMPGSRFRARGIAGCRGGPPPDADGRGDIESRGRGGKLRGHRRTVAGRNRGFCGALLLIDRNTGHLISEAIWDSPKALAARRSAAAAVRVETVKAMGCVI